MTDSGSPERICVHCGTARPIDDPVCPSCGKPWVDERIDEGATAVVAGDEATSEDTEPLAETPHADAAEAAEAAEATAKVEASDADVPQDADVAATGSEGPAGGDATEELLPAGAAAAATAAAEGDRLDDTGEFTFDDWTLPPEAPKRRARWLIPIILLVAVIVVWVLVFIDDDTPTTTTVAQAPVTTIAPTTTAEPTTTTLAATTTSSSTTTTTIDYPPPSAWEAIGDPIPTDELTLRQSAIGPLDFGDSITFVAGRLTASLGEAESATVDGLCPPAESYALQWGELLAIFDGFRSDAAFVSYRYEDLGSDRQLGLTTLSGLALGDTVAELKSIYARFDVTFETIADRDHFRLLDGDELLLWGPVSGTGDNDVVEGIYSPSPCEDA